MKQSILITTAISYPNGPPHIGHMYEAIIADFLVRSAKLFGNDTKLLTGIDSHGKKIQTTAKFHSMTPIELCNMNEIFFKDMLCKSRVEYDRFIRTTDQDHIDLVQDSILRSAKFISMEKYNGYYNVREESYVTETEAKISDYKDPVTGINYEKREEENYTFKLSLFKEFIKTHLSKIKNFDVLSLNQFLDDLKDLSISRGKTEEFDWGIDYPNDNSHIVYVWEDALKSYITGALSLIPDFYEYNHKTVHVIGKDIVKFHGIIYPALLKATNKYQIYDTIYVHGFILDKNGNKMSKSMGNVIDPNFILSKYPLDAIRYYLFFETIPGMDVKFNEERLIEVYNTKLVNEFGNLFQRFYKLLNDVDDYDFLSFTFKLSDDIKTDDYMDLPLIKSKINDLVKICNVTITNDKPWKMEISDKKTVMMKIGCYVYNIMCLLSIIIPDKIKELNSYIGFNIPNITYDSVVFYRYKPGVKAFEKLT